MAILAHAGGNHGPVGFSSLPQDIALDGSASSSSYGTITEYLWSIVGGPVGHGAALDDPTASHPNLLGVDIPGDYVLFLVVRDSAGYISQGGYDAGGSLAVNDYDLMGTVTDAFSVTVATTENADLELPDDLLLKDEWGDAYRELAAALDSLFGTVSGYTSASHAPDAHAASHETGGTDPIAIENVGTTEIDSTRVLNPDGVGGVAWGAPGAATVPDPLTVGRINVTDLACGAVSSNVGVNDIGFDNDSGDVELTANGNIPLSAMGDITFTSGGVVKIDDLYEMSPDHGVHVEGVVLKDGGVTLPLGTLTAPVVQTDDGAVYAGRLECTGPLINTDLVLEGAPSGGIALVANGTADVSISADGGGALAVDRIKEHTGSHGVDIEDCNVLGTIIQANAIDEATAGHGVQLDGARVKDGVVRDKNSSIWPGDTLGYWPITTGWENLGKLREFTAGDLLGGKSKVEVTQFFWVNDYDGASNLELRVLVGDAEIAASAAGTPTVGDCYRLRVELFNVDQEASTPHGAYIAYAELFNITKGTFMFRGGLSYAFGGVSLLQPTVAPDIILQAKWGSATTDNKIFLQGGDVRLTREEA